MNDRILEPFQANEVTSNKGAGILILQPDLLEVSGFVYTLRKGKILRGKKMDLLFLEELWSMATVQNTLLVEERILYFGGALKASLGIFTLYTAPCVYLSTRICRES